MLNQATSVQRSCIRLNRKTELNEQAFMANSFKVSILEVLQIYIQAENFHMIPGQDISAGYFFRALWCLVPRKYRRFCNIIRASG